jgi:hypothetical protein
MLKPATTNPLLRKTMALVQNWTSAEFAVVTASRKALVTAKETYWTSAAFAAVTASRKALVTAKETYWTSAAFAAVMALLKALVIAMVLCLPTVMIALAFA